jgi:hypothetical protein
LITSPLLPAEDDEEFEEELLDELALSLLQPTNKALKPRRKQPKIRAFMGVLRTWI